MGLYLCIAQQGIKREHGEVPYDYESLLIVNVCHIRMLRMTSLNMNFACV